MTGKTIKVPNADHPITIEPTAKRVVVVAAGRTIADSVNAVTLREAGYGPVHYIPRADVDMGMLHDSDHTTYCPYKGDCSYLSIAAGGARGLDAVWVYAEPFAAVAAIKDHLAFYPDRVDSISLLPV